MTSTAGTTDKQRPFNWSFSLATACTLALHAVAFLMVLAPVMAPQAAERIQDKGIIVHMPDSRPEPPKPPPAPEPPPKPHPQVTHTALPPTPVQLPPPAPVLVSEASPMTEVALPPVPPTSRQANTNVRPSAMISYSSKYQPKYPMQAIRQRQEGTVQLKILVGMEGKPLKIRIMASSGYRSLDHAAIAAARQWKFNPARQNGVPRQGWVIIPIEFSLKRL